MSIKKRIENDITGIDVFVKVRDQAGRQNVRRMLAIKSAREALKIEMALKAELEAFRSKVLWSTWVHQCLE